MRTISLLLIVSLYCAADAYEGYAQTTPQRLTQSPMDDLLPKWQPGGNKIAYRHRIATSPSEIAEVGMVNADGTGEVIALDGPNFPFGAGLWTSWVGASDNLLVNETVSFWEFLEFNTAMAPFVRTVFNGNDAANIMKLTTPGGQGAQIPVVSRDGSTVLWIAQIGSTFQLRTASYASMAGGSTSAHGTLLKSGTNGLSFFSGHDLTPDGSQYVIAEASGAGRDLFVYNINGTLSHQLTTSGQTDGYANITPAISPDGTQVAFAYCDGGPCVIQTINLNGTGVFETHTDPSLGSVGWPTWSPDGTRFAYNRGDTGLPGGEPDNLNIYVQNFGTLPVELTAFTALSDGADVYLAWRTATETNNAGFEIEAQRSTSKHSQVDRSDAAFDGEIGRNAGSSDWERVGFVAGHGSTRASQSYSHRLSDLEPGVYGFRLKQIDFDGTFAYSPEVEVTIEVPGTHVLTAAYPNPFTTRTLFRFTVAQEQSVEVTLHDIGGRLVESLFEGHVPAQQAQRIEIESAEMPSGLYVYRITGVNFTESRMVTLQK